MTNPKIKSSIRGLGKLACAAAIAVVMMTGFGSSAYADWDHRGDPHGNPHDHGQFRGWNDHDWRGGHWYHGVHDGRPGAWWIVGGHYYYYPQVVGEYPPNPYAPPVVYAPPPVVVAPPPPSPGINLILPIHIR